MRKLKWLLAFAAFAFAVFVGGQFATSEVSNIELQSDLRDLSGQLNSRIGLESFHSDDDLRKSVIHSALMDGIELKPGQVTVQHIDSGDASGIYLAADYKTRVNLVFSSYSLHFTPSSAR
jgi:hypothetical protein